MTAPAVDFAELVREQQFETLVRDHQPRAVRVLYALCGNWADAEEAVQETVLNLWANRQQLDSVDNPAALLILSSKRTLWRLRYAQASRRPVLLGEHIERIVEQRQESSGLPCMAEPETAERVRQAVETLPPEVRLVVDLHCLQGKSINEVMAETGKNRHAVHQLLYRALRLHSNWTGPQWRKHGDDDPEADALRSSVRLLAALPPRVREAAWLRYVDGLPRATVAQRMRIPEKAVSNLLRKARVAARTELASASPPA